jgi:hypothetical protein
MSCSEATDMQFIVALRAISCTQISHCYLLAHTPSPGSQDTHFLQWCEILLLNFFFFFALNALSFKIVKSRLIGH